MKKLLSFCLVIALVFSLTACAFTDKPETTVTKFCKALKTLDFDAASACFESGKANFQLPSDEELAEIKEALTEQDLAHFMKWIQEMAYTVGDAAIDGDTATVPVTFTYVDAGPVLVEVLGEYLSQAFGLAFSGADEAAIEELLGTILEEKLKTVETKTATAEVEFVCVKCDDGWKMQALSEDAQKHLANIISCNLIGTMEDFVENMESSLDFG